MDASNISTTNDIPDSLPVPSVTTRHISQLGIGSFALLANVVILLILVTNRKFRRKAAFIFALALANSFVGFAYAYSSAYRIVLIAFGRPTVSTTASACLVTMMPEFYFLSNFSLAAVLLVNGVERLLAVLAPTWYFHNWKPEKNWCLVGLIFAFAVISTMITSINASLNVINKSLITTECLWNSVAGEGFASFIFLCSIVGGLGAVVTTLGSLALGVYRYVRLPVLYSSVEVRKRAKRQLQLTKAMLSVAFLDFLLVVIPNVFLLLSAFGRAVPTSIIIYSLYMYNANAVLNILAHVVFNSEFRKAAVRFFKCKGWNMGSSAVSP